jgi:glycosyltransferase involved in cell wall biosynthesis
MRILVVNSFVGRGAGGQERVALDLAMGLDKMGHTVSILGPYSQCDDLRRRIPNRIAVFEEPWETRGPGAESAFELFRAAFRIIRRERIEIVSGHGRMFGVYLACCLTRVYLVWTLHGAGTTTVHGPLDLKSAVICALFRRLSRGRLSRLVAVSDFTRTCFLRMLKDSKNSKVTVIRNGIAALPVLSDMPVPSFTGVVRLGYVGRVERHKGVFELVPLCERLKYLRVPFSLRIFGNGSEEEPLRQALSRSIGSTVYFEGYEGDVQKIYSSFDVLVHPAQAEWLGTNLIESQAAARVAIAYRSGGNPEVIIDSVSGFTAQPGDTDGLAAIIESIYQNPAAAAQVAVNARRSAQRYFSLDRMCGEYELLFRELSNQW